MMTCAPLAQSSAPPTCSKAAFVGPLTACALLPSLSVHTTASIVGQIRTIDLLGMSSDSKASLRRASLERWKSPSALTPFNRTTLRLIRRHTTSTCMDCMLTIATTGRASKLRPTISNKRLTSTRVLRQRQWDSAGRWPCKRSLDLPPWLRPTSERAAVLTAIRLDPKSGEAHAWLGRLHTAYDWDWAAADAELKEALRLSPRVPTVLACAARLSEALGHWDEAIRLLDSAIARDPLFAGALNVLSGVYARAGRLAEAEATERRVLEISPTYASAPSNLALVLLARGRRDEALKVIQQSTEPDDRAQGLALIYYALGRKADSDAQLATLTREHANDDAFEIVETHAYRGEIDEALRWLDRAYAQKDSNLYLVKGDRLLERLESDPRYKAFLRKMKLPE